MAQVLKMFQLANQDRVPKVQIGSGRVEACLHPQWTPLFGGLRQTLAQIFLADEFGQTLL